MKKNASKGMRVVSEFFYDFRTLIIEFFLELYYILDMVLKCGVIAQLGERYNGIVEVRSSILLGSTTKQQYSNPVKWIRVYAFHSSIGFPKNSRLSRYT